MTQIGWGSIVGVIVGFLLSQLANVVGFLISSRKEKRLIRVLVALEIDQNLALLNDYWHNVSLEADEEDEDNRPKLNESEVDRLGRRAAEIPLPVLCTKALDSQLSGLPKALNENEIRSTWRVYEEIAQIETLHSWLLEITNMPKSDSESFPSASRAIRSEELLSATFKTKKAAAIFDLRKTIQQLLAVGNPLNRSNKLSEPTP